MVLSTNCQNLKNPEIHSKHLKTSPTPQKHSPTFFKNQHLIKPRPHQKGQ